MRRGLPAAQPDADFILYLAIDAMVDEIFPLVDQVSDQIEDSEAEILKNLRPRDLPKTASPQTNAVFAAPLARV